MTELALIHPMRSKSSFRPFKAYGHFRKLMKDKEDTEQVFHIINDLRGSDFITQTQTFAESEVGRSVLERNEFLPNILDNHDELRKLPAGSVGRAYVDFMEREGLTAAGLVEEYDKFADRTEHYDDMMEWYSDRLRDTHDLFHILTGYGRDALGEQALLAFSYSQNKNWGVLFIAYAGAMNMRNGVPRDSEIMKVVREGQRLGKAAQKIAHQDIEALLAEPLEAARARLNIEPPIAYYKAHDVMRGAGLDPYDLLVDGAVAA